MSEQATRWASTRGLVVVRNASMSDVAPGWLSVGMGCFKPTEWTVSKPVAEGRWRKALAKAAESAERKAQRPRKAATGAPPYEEW